MRLKQILKLKFNLKLIKNITLNCHAIKNRIMNPNVTVYTNSDMNQVENANNYHITTQEVSSNLILDI